jgi:hypothetical protein
MSAAYFPVTARGARTRSASLAFRFSVGWFHAHRAHEAYPVWPRRGTDPETSAQSVGGAMSRYERGSGMRPVNTRQPAQRLRL